MNASKSLFLIQGHHLFHPRLLKPYKNDLFLMIEDREQLTSFKFHKHHQVHFLSAMRHYARELQHFDFNLVYFELLESKNVPFERFLEKALKESGLNTVTSFEVEDKAREGRLINFCEENNYRLEIKESPLFLVSREEFKEYLERHPGPSIKSFYENQRRKHKILMETGGTPLGGRYSFGDEERIKWTSKNETPKFPIAVHDEIDHEVLKLVEKEFPDHPGEALTSWYPTTREAVFKNLEDFCKYRLAEFGPYEDAIGPNQDFLFHSVLSPGLNVGLITPQEVLDTVMTYASENPVPLNSLESFVKKILGYREYSRGMYQNFSEIQETSNFWNHHRLLNTNWYEGKTGVPPLDDSLKRALRLSYNHHTERLKVICNMMTLAEIYPPEAYRWFMEMHLDSVVWAAQPNVFGLGLYADGGLFDHTLHIYGSNSWLKISTYQRAEWCDEVDGLYWRFIEKHRSFFNKNSRLSLAANNLDRMSSERKERLWRAAETFLARNTLYP